MYRDSNTDTVIIILIRVVSNALMFFTDRLYILAVYKCLHALKWLPRQ